MRFQRIQAPSFGPFTDFELTFPENPVDLQVVYGANEAGKSSLLRAIRDLLFGIRHRSTDNFLHDYEKLRIKGEIRNRAGELLVFQRWKRNQNSLRDADEKPLPESALAPFLGSVDQSYFSAMFGLGARELHEGAQQLLRGEGAMGNALFSASMGGTPIPKVIEALQQEADRIFKGRATANVSIRPTAKRYKELIKQSQDAVVDPDTWDKNEQELDKAVAEKKQLEDELSGLQLGLEWIQRCEDAQPTVGRFNEEMEKLAAVPPLPDLASDYIARAKAARLNAGKTQAEVQHLTDQIEGLRKQLRDCKTSPGILAEADILDQMRQDLGVYRERKKSLADLRETLAGLEPILRASMKDLQLGGEFASLEGRRLSTPTQLACEEAAGAMQEALREQSTNADKAESLQSQITKIQEDLEVLPETNLDPLREALAVAAEATDADRTIAASEAEVQRLTRETASQHHLVANAPEDIATTAQLFVPALATIRRYHGQMEDIQREIVIEESKVRDGQMRGESNQAELVRLQRQGELPTEEALRKAREHRDHGWNLVLAEWKGDGAKEELIPEEPLEIAFPRAIEKADEIADILRRNAEAVAQAEEKRFQLSEVAKQVDDARQKIQKLRGALAECQLSWRGEWAACGIAPRSPSEMEEWRTQWGEFRERFGKLETAKESLARKAGQIQAAKQRLAAVLGQAEKKEYSLLFAAARKLVQDGEQAAGQHKDRLKRLEDLKSELARFEKNRDRLNKAVTHSIKKWKSQCVDVGLPEGASPDVGLTLLRERKDLLVKFDKWQELVSKARSTTEAVSQYEENVSGKAATLDISGDTTEALESALWKALKLARESQIRHNQLAGQIEQTRMELSEAQRLAELSGQALKELIRLASLKTVDELEPLLAHLEKRNAVRAQIDGLRDSLTGFARGQSVDDFVSKVRSENPDALTERKAAAAREINDKKFVLSGIRDTLLRLGNEKKALERAGDDAADFRQQAESCAAALKQDAARYLRLRLATHLLQSQIERFRKENQGPLLQKSGEIFQVITRGAFSGLGADFNADDVPVLAGIRPIQIKVPVDGFSDGSRDQLYLALRLAALDRYLGEHEPMPLILDDLLITFDDDRAKTILPLLGDMANRTQIFLFTHHEHLVELCRKTLGENQFHIHRLGDAT